MLVWVERERQLEDGRLVESRLPKWVGKPKEKSGIQEIVKKTKKNKCAQVGGQGGKSGCWCGWRERQLADGGCALLGIQELRWTQIAADQQGHVSNMPFLMSRFFRGRNQKRHPMVMA